MKYCRIWAGLFIAAVVSGCATQGRSTFNYLEPVPLQIKNEMVVAKPYTQVWDGLVKQLSKSFYVINNIDKESRIINVSFSTNSPSDYADCGRMHRTYSQGGKTEEFDYDSAGPSEFKAATERQPSKQFAYYILFRRETSLEGRCNIYVAPDENDSGKTIVTVNTRYIWTVKVKGRVEAVNVKGYVVDGAPIPEESNSIIFNTNQPGQYIPSKGPKIVCTDKGKLEDEILQMLNK